MRIKHDGTLIAGHGHLAAAKLLGRKAVPAVRVSHLDDAQKRALRLADNKIAENAGWVEKLLAIEFAELVELDLSMDLSFDLAVRGFASAEIDRLVETGGEANSPDIEDEAIPKMPAEPVARLRDVFELRDHRIICAAVRAQNAPNGRLSRTHSKVSTIERYEETSRGGAWRLKRGSFKGRRSKMRTCADAPSSAPGIAA